MNGAAQAIPHSREAETSVVGKLLATPGLVPEVIGEALLEPGHFYDPTLKALFTSIKDAYEDDAPIDPLSIAERCSKTLARSWGSSEAEVVQRVESLARGQRHFAGAAVDHAKVVKRHHDYRRLLDLAAAIQQGVQLEQDAPDTLAGVAAQDAMRIATDTLANHEIVPFDDVGRRVVKQQQLLRAARDAGVELGVKFGLPFLDSHTRILKPTELFVLAGEPGAGKSAVAWEAARGFAERQMRRPEAKRMGALILSLEMGEEPASNRVAQGVAKLDGGKLREGTTTDADLRKIALEWTNRKGLPLYFNFTSQLRSGQMKALIVESIRRHRVGYIVIDHMRYFTMEGRFASKQEEDEEKSRFLKEAIAKELNVAVMVLAHTTKAITGSDDRRPELSHLRGSGQIAGDADFVAFVYRPYMHASQEAIDEGSVKRTDAELIWGKNRHGLDSISRFHLDPTTMTVR